ncbi:TonB-dependent receptor domain-containing protein [Sphingomonas sp. M1-B02]|uniref:TonB-dependent receptor domain-containing protein n=1 Tax=Sphingomonas sp. M1-B02 TaxID=3114300 RepID=UPI00223E997C|nr:TonB-dependent receptor [Sphingomonas sp. S6-11]UZK65433.1 TonB-dependent receptor [Sphingomonas sp. S6-11]
MRIPVSDSARRVSMKACLLVGICTSIIPQTASAQEAQPATAVDEQSIPPADAANTPPDEQIVVTGSRIARAGYDTLEPATTVDSAYLETRGITNVAEALTTTPSFGLGQTATGNQGSYNAGQAFVDRFSLGSARTLTLVNGRRFVSTNAPSVQGNVVGTPAPAGLQVDLNAIPSILIDRIDNLSIGGAPAYGSDAIAGVVNIILKQKYQGLKVTALSGITELGDNFRANVSALAGTNFAGGRGNIMIAGSYDRSEGLLSSSRERVRKGYGYQSNPLATSAAAAIPGRTFATDGRVNTAIPFNTGNTDGIPNAVLIQNTRIGVLTAGGVVSPIGALLGADTRVRGFGATGNTRLQFDTEGNLVPYDPGMPFSSTYASGGDGFTLFNTDPLLATVERYNLNANASFEATDNLTLFVEGSYYRGKAQEEVDQGPYNSGLFSTDRGNNQAALIFSTANPFLTQQARNQLNALGVTQFQVQRVNMDLTNGASRSDNQVYRIVTGLTNDFNVMGKEFRLDASFNYGRTNGNYYVTALNQQNFVNALNVKLDGTGKIVCDPTPAFNGVPGGVNPTADAACVPLNLFGDGRRSQAALEYVTQSTRARSALEQTVASVNLSTSELVRLWSGPVGFSIGAEARREFGSFTPDPLDAAGKGRFAPIASVSGSFNTKEVFGELAVPLVSRENHVPLIHSLEVEGRARYVDNSVNGGFWTYTGGARYQPFLGLTFRGNYTRSLRAPSTLELFLPPAVSSGFFPDPCDSRNITGGTNPAIRQRNCAAFFTTYGINPTSFTSIAVNANAPMLSGGNQNLNNEAANAYTFGIVFNPSFMPKLSLAVDWNRIKVVGNIVALSPTAIAQGCYDNPDFDIANPDAGNSFCTMFTRDRGGERNGQIVSSSTNPGVRSSYVNGGYILLKALTATMSLRDLDLGMDGTKLSLNSNFYYVDQLCQSDNLVTVICTQGTTNSPRWTGQFGAVLSNGPFSLFGEVNYRPGTKYDLNFTNETRDILSIGSMTTTNAAIAYDDRDNGFTMRLSVNNALNAIPPYPSTVGDMLGRRFLLSVGKSY